MTRFQGYIGYASNEETSPGVFMEIITEKACRGELLRLSQQNRERQDSTNANVLFNNKFSIIADEYATLNFPQIRYISWNGTKWSVTNVEIQRPRLIITVGGIYNVNG